MKYKLSSNIFTLISSIGQGMGIGGYLAKNASYGKEHVYALKYGIDLGLTFIDTSEEYGHGEAENIIGQVVKDIRDRVTIATKVSSENLTYNNVIKSAEQSLKRLNTEYIDLYQIHWPNPKIPITETMKGMEKLIKDGKIKYIGVCNFSLNELQEAEKVLEKNKLFSIQMEYNLLERTIENSILPYCEQRNIITIAYSPLRQGKFIKDVEKIKELKEISNKYNKTIAQIALNWLISHPTVTAIPQTINFNHIKENAEAADFSLLEEDLNKLNKIFECKLATVPTERIRVVMQDKNNNYILQTLDDALQNKQGFTPTPMELAQDILEQNDMLKPVRLIKSLDKTGKYDYDLIEGRLRYWAWVIAYNGKKPIAAYIN